MVGDVGEERRDTASDGVTGFVCPPADPRAVAARFDELERDRERARALGAAGRQQVAAIDWDDTIARLTLQRMD